MMLSEDPWESSSSKPSGPATPVSGGYSARRVYPTLTLGVAAKRLEQVCRVASLSFGLLQHVK